LFGFVHLNLDAIIKLGEVAMDELEANIGVDGVLVVVGLLILLRDHLQ
jgi:hypothetical protein